MSGTISPLTSISSISTVMKRVPWCPSAAFCRSWSSSCCCRGVTAPRKMSLWHSSCSRTDSWRSTKWSRRSISCGTWVCCRCVCLNCSSVSAKVSLWRPFGWQPKLSGSFSPTCWNSAAPMSSSTCGWPVCYSSPSIFGSCASVWKPTAKKSKVVRIVVVVGYFSSISSTF